LVVVLAAGGGAYWLYINNVTQPVTGEFNVVSELAVDGNAEIIAATPDGLFLVHTNPQRSSIDVIDISDPALPLQVGRMQLPGEPTSVGISPDGRWALATLHMAKPKTGEAAPHPRTPGGLAIIDISATDAPLLTEIIGIGHQPDSIAVGESGAELVAVVAVENQPVVEKDGTVTGEEEPGNADDISLAGQVQAITFNPLRQNNYRVSSLDLSAGRLNEAGLDFADDAQPEFATLSADLSLAAVSLQENNGIVVFDPYWLETRRMFSTGKVADRKADISADDVTLLDSNYPGDISDQPHAGNRLPDGIAFTPDGNYIISADEGEMPLTGGRGISVWSIDGDFIWDDGGRIEAEAAAAGLYPDDRSEEKGIEVEGVATASFGDRDFAFAVAERGGFVAVFDISNPLAPAFVQLLQAGEEPEGIVAIPDAGLVAVAAEGSGSIHVYRRAAELQNDTK
ncbi:MAG: hypothetical protein KJP03_02325, partial [Gammaproteobacteria bacterium]|nr:hypothetical protein [Gammaproteobacteria bacterium]